MAGGALMAQTMAEPCRFRWNGDDHTNCPRCGGTNIDPMPNGMMPIVVTNEMLADQQREISEAITSMSKQAQRLRTSHNALLCALSWCVEHADECLADHPDIFAAACAAAAAAKDV